MDLDVGGSCIALLPMFAGREIVTVEGIAEDGLHPVQEAMVACYGSQCGYCTPGFTVSMFEAFYRDVPLSPAVINDQLAGNRSVRFHLTGTQSNRDGIGASVRIEYGGVTQSRLIKGGSSYLSQSELPVTFGVGKLDKIAHAVIQWPNGRTEEFKDLATGRGYDCVEGKGTTARAGF